MEFVCWCVVVFVLRLRCVDVSHVVPSGVLCMCGVIGVWC